MLNLPMLMKKKQAQGGGGAFAYPFAIDYSMELARADSDRIYHTYPATPIPTDNKTFTLDTWVKKTAGEASYHTVHCSFFSATYYTALWFDANDKLVLYGLNNGAAVMNLSTAAVFRDPSHHYAIHLQVDTTQATSTDRVRLWVNGTEYALTGTFPALNAGTCLLGFQSWTTSIGCYALGQHHFDGYISNHHYFDGAIVPHTEFGEFVNNTWVPKQFAGGYSYGNLGFYLDFADSGDMGNDVSGNGNDFIVSNSPVQSEDTPTNNYATLDPLTVFYSETVTKAGLLFNGNAAAWRSISPTMEIPKTGKWYMEMAATTLVSNIYHRFGIVNELNIGGTAYPGSTSTNGCSYRTDGRFDYFGSYTTAPAQWANDRCGIMFDADADIAYFYKVTAPGTATLQRTQSCSGLGGDVRFFAMTNYSTGSLQRAYIADSDLWALPVDAKTLCTANLPIPEVFDSEQGLWIPTWTGDGTTRNITGCPFNVSAKGMAWFKNMDAGLIGANDMHHVLFDTVRGASECIYPNLSNAEVTEPNLGYLSAFLSNGFTVGPGSVSSGYVNASGYDHIAWVFNMLPQYGMDIVTYTGDGVAGRTVAHNLGVAPEMMIVKRRDAVGNWMVYHHIMSADPETDYLLLNGTAIATDDAAIWNDTAPDAANFTVGTNGYVNADSGEYVAYLFRSVPGLLKVGFYLGTGDADAPRIYTDFRPRFFMTKKASGAVAGWRLHDAARNPYNVVGESLVPTTSAAEESTYNIDFLSNGVKIRNNFDPFNQSGSRIIYLAFGDAFPFVNAV